MTHDTHPWTLTSQGREPRQRASAVPVSSTYQNGLDRLGMHSTSTTKLYPKIHACEPFRHANSEFSDRLVLRYFDAIRPGVFGNASTIPQPTRHDNVENRFAGG